MNKHDQIRIENEIFVAINNVPSNVWEFNYVTFIFMIPFTNLFLPGISAQMARDTFGDIYLTICHLPGNPNNKIILHSGQYIAYNIEGLYNRLLKDHDARLMASKQEPEYQELMTNIHALICKPK